MLYRFRTTREVNAAKALILLSVLEGLVERGWLVFEVATADTARAWISDQHYAMCSTGEKLLLDVLDAIANDMGAPLAAMAAHLDDRNKLAVLGALATLFGLGTEAAVSAAAGQVSA